MFFNVDETEFLKKALFIALSDVDDNNEETEYKRLLDKILKGTNRQLFDEDLNVNLDVLDTKVREILNCPEDVRPTDLQVINILLSFSAIPADVTKASLARVHKEVESERACQRALKVINAAIEEGKHISADRVEIELSDVVGPKDGPVEETTIHVEVRIDGKLKTFALTPTIIAEEA